jgi:hypothetical protein
MSSIVEFGLLAQSVVKLVKQQAVAFLIAFYVPDGVRAKIVQCG